MEFTIFAKILNNEIVQYPMSLTDIQNASPVDQILPCYPMPYPAYDAAIQKLIDKPIVLIDMVLINYEVVNKTIDELFAELMGLATASGLSIADVPPALLNAFVIKIKELTQLRLDTWAQTRGYDDVHSVCSYVNSTVPTFVDEANRAVLMRDTTWMALHDYLNQLLTGVQPLPTSWSEIEALLPVLSWQ